MSEVFSGSAALAAGRLTRGRLRWNYRAIFPDVYLPQGTPATLYRRTLGAALWSGHRAVIAGRAAAALHGARWVDEHSPVELIFRSAHPPPGIVARNERITAEELTPVGGLTVTSPARTALDLARHLPRDAAVPLLDALARATGVDPESALALADALPRARGLQRARVTLPLLDAGAESRPESTLRLLLIDAGLPRPQTQIRVTDGSNVAFIDLGYEESLLGLDYDGRWHSTDRRAYVKGIGRDELIRSQGWIDLHVVAEHSRAFILHRVARAFAERGRPVRLRIRR